MYKVSKSTIDWLLETSGNHVVQPVVYLTYKNLLGKSERSKSVKEAKAAINEYPPIKKILSKAPFFWKPGEFLYRKYEGGFWQLLFLAELYANPEHTEIKRGVEFILDRADEDGFYSVHCLSANLYRAMLQFGYREDDRVLRGLEYQCRRIINNGGADCFVMDYSLLPTCHMTLSKILFALSLVPKHRVTPVMKRARAKMVKEMKDTQVYIYVPSNNEEYKKQVEQLGDTSPVNRRRSVRDDILQFKAEFSKSPGLGKRLEKTSWFRFGYPNSYNSDVLDVMSALAAIGARKHKEFTKALERIKEKMKTDADGRQYWIMENSLNDRMIATVEEKGKPSKWLTYNAIRVFQHFEGISIAA
jgi:hypothetical protein